MNSMAQMKRKPKWKVVFLKKPDPLYLYDFRNLVTCLNYRRKETFDIFYPEGVEWIWCFTNFPNEICGCGRSYNGFRMRDSFLNGPENLEERLEWLKLPVLCMFCFYKKQHGEGNWIPRKVQRELGLEN
jgi:hypothetical protein